MSSICSPFTKMSTGIRLQQAQYQPQDGGLPGAAGAQEDLGVPGLQREADVAQDHLVVEGEVHAVEDDDRTAVRQRLVEQRRAVRGSRIAIRYMRTMRTWVTR